LAWQRTVAFFREKLK
ncbi:MAG TPA: hypothetical protein PK198_05010, partial [Saprospiraceae bacterium]|nr:hypothetical protein [Saprospiraceae bacterium]